jgi:hypothetical protein
VANKTLKDYAKEAKKRMKSSFWQDYKAKLNSEILKAEESGESPSKITQYYQNKASVTVKGVKSDEEEFYQKVKTLLSTVGEVSDALGRLTDKEYFNSLSYDQKQRYTLELSAKYVKAKERYYKELQFEKTV